MLFNPLEMTLLFIVISSISYYIGRELGYKNHMRELIAALENVPDFDITFKDEKDDES